VFPRPNADSLWESVNEALLMYRQQAELWRQLALTGMRQDFSWEASAQRYADWYREALAERQATGSTES
jgi:starch synthase